MQAFALALIVASTTAMCVASPVIRPAPVYGPPPGAYQRYLLARAPPPPLPLSAPSGPSDLSGLSLPANHPGWISGWARAPSGRTGSHRPPGPPGPPGPPPATRGPSADTQHPQQYFRQESAPPSQQYRTELQGIWRYTVPARPRPLQEDEVPHQGLGAAESVTMPEQPPFDPLLAMGPSGAYLVRSIIGREPHYFTEFPHTRLVLSNQQMRLDNGLPANRLGSIRRGSDFLLGS